MIASWNARKTIFLHISDERERQEAKFTGWSVASDALNDNERLAILTEEVGEVARELCERLGKCRSPMQIEASEAMLRRELVQTAAVCVAWIEALDRPLLPVKK